MSDSRKRRQNSGLRSRTGSGEIPQRSSQHQHGRAKMNQSQSKGNFQRQSSYDRVRKIVQEEGRSARNLIQYSLPVEEKQSQSPQPIPEIILKQTHCDNIDKEVKTSRSPHRKPHQRSHSTGKIGINGERRDRTPPPKKSVGIDDFGSGSSYRSGARVTTQKKDLRARYWAFLFENLRRAVDEIYQTCEADESVVECKEVIMMLEQCTKDFKSLIQRHVLLKAYENAEEGQKPTSLAWEVRKSSPGKSLTAAAKAKEHLIPSPTVSRSLNFNCMPGNSWADKVKGIAPSPPVRVCHNERPMTSPAAHSDVSTTKSSTQEEDALNLTAVEDADMDGWETVHRGGRNKNRTNSTSSLSGMKQVSEKAMNGHGKHVQLGNSSPQQSTTFKDATISPAKRDQAVHPPPTRSESKESEKENQPLPDKNVVIANQDISEIVKSENEDIVKKNVKTVWGKPVIETLDDSTKKTMDSPLTVDIPRDPIDVEHDLPIDTSTLESTDDVLNKSTESMPEEEILVNKDDDIHDECIDEENSLEPEQDEADRELASLIQHACEEEDSLDKELQAEREAALESAIKEEESYLKQIEREQNLQIELLDENDPDNDGDGETDNELNQSSSMLDASQQTLDWDTLVQTYEAEAQNSWGDIVAEEETRTPGRVVHMHEKLSSPSRKRTHFSSPTESRKRHEEKQAKAQELREKMLTEKAERLRQLTKKKKVPTATLR